MHSIKAISCRSRKKNRTLIRQPLILLVWFLPIAYLFSTQIYAQDASLSGSVLSIPSVAVDGQVFSVDLTLVPNTDPVELILTAAEAVTSGVAENAGVFSGSTLSVYSIPLQDVSYWANFRLISDNPVTFRLDSVGVNENISDARALATQLFESSISKNIVQPRCIACHVQDGVAGSSTLIFAPESNSSLLTNMNSFEQLLAERENGAAYILSKASGGEAHTGGVQLPLGSSDYRQLEEFLTLLLGEVIDAPDGSVERTFLSGITLESRVDTLRRAAIVFSSRLPSEEEIEQVIQGDDLTLRETLRDLLTGEGFKEFLIEGIENRLLTEATYPNLDFANFPYSSSKIFALAKEDESASRAYLADLRWSVHREPGELAYYIAESERSYKEILTANYVMLNPLTNEAFGGDAEFIDPTNNREYRPGVIGAYYTGEQVTTGECRVPMHFGCEIVSTGTPTIYPHAGLLTNINFLMRYPTTLTNRNRARAKATFFHFLGMDIEKAAQRPTDAAALQDTNNPTLNNPSCTVCHIIMDPVAGAFQNWNEYGFYRPNGLNGLPRTYTNGSDPTSLFQVGDLWYRDMLSPGLFDQPIDEGESPLQELASLIVEDQRFISASVEFWWESVFGRPLLGAPTLSTDADYDESLQAYSAQRETIDELAMNFSADFNLKNLFVDMIMSPWFSAKNTANTEFLRAYEISGIGSEKLLTPEQLSRKVKALTGWYEWGQRLVVDSVVMPPRNNLETLWEYSLLYGGIDSSAILKRVRELNAPMTAVAIYHGTESSCPIVVNEFALENDQRMLFKDIDHSVTPYTEESEIFSVESSGLDDFENYSITANLTPEAELVSITYMNQMGERNQSGVYEATNLALNMVSLTNLSTGIVEEYDIFSSSVLRSWGCNIQDDAILFSRDCTVSLPVDVEQSSSYEIAVSLAGTLVAASMFENQVAVSVISGVNSSLSNSSGEIRIKAKIVELFEKFHGKSYSLADPNVTALYDLFVETWLGQADKREFDGTRYLMDPFRSCRILREMPSLDIFGDNTSLYEFNSVDEIVAFRFDADSNHGVISTEYLSDPFFIKYTWSVVILALMTDYNFLVE